VDLHGPPQAPVPHASSRPVAPSNRLQDSPAAMVGASRPRRCRAQRARYVIHDSSMQLMGRTFGIISGRGIACLHRTMTTGDSVGSSSVSSPPWRKPEVLASCGDAH
jgi:hypothetical protein